MGRIISTYVLLAACALGSISVSELAAQQPSGEAPPRPEKIRAWPLYHSEVWPDGRSERDALFSIFHAKSSNGESAVRLVPVYWAASSAAEQRRLSLLVPFYYYERDPFVTTLVTPVFRGTKTALGGDAAAGVPYLLELFRRSRSGEASDLSLLAFVPWGPPGRDPIAFARHNRDVTGKVWHSHALPIYYYGLGDRGGEDHGLLVIPPLLYGRHWRGEVVDHLILPLLGWARFDHAERSLNLILGLLSKGEEGSAHRWLRLEPLYSQDFRDHSGRYEIAHIYGHEWDRQARWSAHRFLFSLGYFRDGPEDRYDRRFLPFFYASNRGGREVLALLPVYASSKSMAHSWRVIVPICYAEKKPDRSTLIVLPNYFRTGDGEQIRQALLPLYYSEASARDSLLVVLGPLYVRERTQGGAPSTRDSVLWPLFQYATQPGGWHFHAFPSVWSTRTVTERVDIIAPFYVRVEDAVRSHHWVLPLWGRYARREIGGATLERTFYALGSVINTERGKPGEAPDYHALHILGPFAGYARDDATSTSHSRLLPLWYRQRERERELTLLFPIYFHRERPGQELALWGGNLFVDRTDGDRHEMSALWPLARYRKQGDNRKFDALLLYSQRNMGASRTLRLTPLLYARDARHKNEAAPYFHLLSIQTGAAQQRWDGLFGLAGRRTSATYSKWHAFPVFAESYFDRESGEPVSWGLTAFPLFEASSSMPGDALSLRIGCGLYAHSHVRKTSYTSNSLLFSLVLDERRANGYRGRFFPLWSYALAEDGARSWSAALTLSSKVHRPGRKARGLLSPDGFYGLQMLRHARGEESVTWAINPFIYGYHRNDKSNRSDWRALLFAAHGHRRPAESAFQVLGALRGQSTPKRSTWSLTPLAHSEVERTRELRSFDWQRVFHVFYRGEDPAKSRWSLLWYLAAGSKDKGNEDFDFRILHRMVHWKREGTLTERSVRPLFTWEKDAKDGYSYQSLLSFVYRAERKNAESPLRRRLFMVIPLWSGA